MRALTGTPAILALLSWLLVACTDEQQDLSQEALRADEAEQDRATQVNFRKLVDTYRTTYTARGAHAKSHACLRAYFVVHEDLAADLQYGVFAQPGRRYRSWIRFSNGHFNLKTSQDYRHDARGMAIKLMQVAGEPLEADDVDTTSQDFLLTNSPVFFVRNVHDYNQLVARPEDFVGFFFPTLNPVSWKLKELFTARITLSAPPASLLDPDYFSITPYKLGPHNVKYAAKPCAERHAEAPAVDEHTDPDFLQKQLAAELAEQAACFQFAIQRQKPALGMSINDPTEPWAETDSAFIPVARISIPSQSFMAAEQIDFCERITFAPWHTLPAHRPIGALNRLRRYAYAASSQQRHVNNHVSIPAALAFWCQHSGFHCQ